ncbi:TIGR03545 family protein [Elusimicrobiota bacterium]
MRWKGFITLSVIIAVTAIFSIFFLDDVIKLTVEKAGAKAWGAKVEIEKVTVNWSPAGINISGFTVASKKEEFKNLLEIGEMKVAIKVVPLFEKKLNVEEVAGEGLLFNTARKTSGFLPVIEKEAKEKETKADGGEEAEKKWKADTSSWMEDIKKRGQEKIDVINGIKNYELKSEKALNEVQQSFTEFKSKYSDMKSVDVGKTVKSLNNTLTILQNIKIKDPQDAAKAGKQLEEAQKSSKDAEKQAKEVKKALKEFQESSTGMKKKIAAIEKARKEDYKAIMEQLKLPSIEVEDMAETVFGPLVTGKFKKVLSYVEKVRKYIPPKKKKEKTVEKPREQGTDIVFVKEKMYPPLHLEKAEITGENNAKIEVKDVTNTPWILGRPVKIQAMYSNYDFNAVIDRTGDAPSESFTGLFNSFSLAGSTGILEIKAEFKDDNVSADMTWKGKGVLPSNWLEYLELHDPEIVLTVKVRGKMNDPKFDLQSNLDEMISSRLKAKLESKIKEARSSVDSILDSKVMSKKRKMESELGSFNDKKTSAMKEQKDKVEGKKKELDNKIEAKQKEIKGAAKKKAEEEGEKLKKDAGDKLKDIFNK